MPIPNFFIVGAPRSGTTAMHEYLRKHPETFMSTPKELHFFAPEAAATGTITDEQEYRALFAQAEGKKVICESSPGYLYPEQTPRRIKAFSPDAKILIMLRDPAEIAYSLHAYRLRNLHEDIPDFLDAFAADTDRAESKRMPACFGKTCPKHFLYRTVGTLSPCVKRYVDVFGENNVRVIVYDDFKKDTAGTYRNLCAFLGIDTHFIPDFPVINDTELVRPGIMRRKLRSFIAFPPQPLAALKHILPKRFKQSVMRALRPFFYAPGPGYYPSAEVREVLRPVFSSEVAALGRMLNRDLGALWGYSNI
jgi:hypothetical protein